MCVCVCVLKKARFDSGLVNKWRQMMTIIKLPVSTWSGPTQIKINKSKKIFFNETILEFEYQESFLARNVSVVSMITFEFVKFEAFETFESCQMPNDDTTHGFR